MVHSEEFRRRTGISHEEWAERVDAAYCGRVSESHRALAAPDLHSVTDAASFQKLRRAWDQTLRRYTSGEMRFPVELEEAWVFALEEPYRTSCIRELSQRYGCYGARIRHDSTEGDHASWGEALQAWGEVTVVMGQVLADGRIDEQDDEHLPKLQSEIERMQADLESLRRHVMRAQGRGA